MAVPRRAAANGGDETRAGGLKFRLLLPRQADQPDQSETHTVIQRRKQSFVFVAAKFQWPMMEFRDDAAILMAVARLMRSSSGCSLPPFAALACVIVPQRLRPDAGEDEQAQCQFRGGPARQAAIEIGNLLPGQ